ncbi:FMN-dependent NADH-azoreductase [Variovorax sp. RHLX14]|uniref:FMN-dependent NADH-azoreductase n=1 Tax=Variovorax sp. RHLX14 TaxID=1259731 RepID=UPI003F468A22
MKLLQVDSSVLGAASASRALTAEVTAGWLRANAGTTVEVLDLAQDTPSHFDANSLGSKVGVQAEPTEAQKRENAVSERLVSQFLAADVIVVGAPLYNFSVPTQLKAWIDRLAQPGRTFRYGEKGPVGLAAGKTVIVVSTRGGVYSTSAGGEAMEHQESYLKTIFGFFGIDDVRIVRAEGLAMGDVARSAAMAAARGQIAAAVAGSEQAVAA